MSFQGGDPEWIKKPNIPLTLARVSFEPTTDRSDNVITDCVGR